MPRGFRCLACLFSSALVASTPAPSASFQLFADSCGSRHQGSDQVGVLNFADTTRLSSQCDSLISLCVLNKTDNECQQVARKAAPKLGAAVAQMTAVLVSLPPELALEVRDTITTTLLSFTSKVNDLVPQFEAVHGCIMLETAVTSLCDELLELAPRIMGLVIPVVVLAVLGVGGCVFYCLSCACLVFCNCGIFVCCLGRRRRGRKGNRRVSFQSRVTFFGEPPSRSVPLSMPLRTKKSGLGKHFMSLH